MTAPARSSSRARRRRSATASSRARASSAPRLQGSPPRIMGIGPAPASEKLMARLGLSIGDFDVIELNEAFASQALAVLRRLGLPDDAAHVNPNGGAIALGHPLGDERSAPCDHGDARARAQRRPPRACARCASAWGRASRSRSSGSRERQVTPSCCDGDVAVFTFDNPPVNALSHPVRAAFLAAIEALDADPARARDRARWAPGGTSSPAPTSANSTSRRSSRS